MPGALSESAVMRYDLAGQIQARLRKEAYVLHARRYLVEIDEPVLGDLLRMERDPLLLLVAENAAMEDEPHPSGSKGGLGRAEVDADQTPSLDLDAALFARLAPTRLPGRLTVGLQLPAGNGPVRNRHPAGA